MIHTIIKKVFKSDNYTLELSDKGISNKNYLLTINNEQFIVREPYPDNVHTLGYTQEKEVSEHVRDLDVPTVYFDETTGIKITNYIPNLVEYKDCHDKDKVERVAQMLRVLHTKPKAAQNFEPLKQLEYYQSQVHKPLYNLDEYHFIIDDIKTLNNPSVLCHNDIVSGNLLFSKKRDYLIDYEYAANNDPLFDVMSFLSENNITDTSIRSRFYAVYFDEINEDILHQLSLWEAFHNMLWCYWAMMLYENRKQDIYKEIASDKYYALLAMNIKKED